MTPVNNLNVFSSKAVAIVNWTLDAYGTSTYDSEEMLRLAEAALSVPDDGLIAEIGVYTGCSASLLLQAARGRDIVILLCDSFRFQWDENAKARLALTLETFPEVQLINALGFTSEEGSLMTGSELDLVHIDGDHSEGGIAEDCRLWLPKLRSGGLAAFHDYQWNEKAEYMAKFPGLKAVVDRATEGWVEVWTGGSYGLTIRRKP